MNETRSNPNPRVEIESWTIMENVKYTRPDMLSLKKPLTYRRANEPSRWGIASGWQLDFLNVAFISIDSISRQQQRLWQIEADVRSKC